MVGKPSTELDREDTGDFNVYIKHTRSNEIQQLGIRFSDSKVDKSEN